MNTTPMNSLNRDQWKEVEDDCKNPEDEIRRILLRNFDNDKYLWSKAHEELLSLFHSELEKVRQETVDCKGQHTFIFSHQTREPQNGLTGSSTAMTDWYFTVCTKCGKINKQALSINKKEQ